MTVRDHAELFQGADEQWYFRILAANGEQIAASEGYTRKDDARDTLLTHWPDVRVVEVED